MEENLYVFAKHKILPEIKRIYCCGDNAGEAYVCMLDENSWVDFLFGKILEEIDYNLLSQLARERLLEHFREKDEVDSAIPTYYSLADGGWFDQLKPKLKKYLCSSLDIYTNDTSVQECFR